MIKTGLKDNIIMYLRKSRADREDESVAETLSRHESQLQEYAERWLGGRIPEERIYREVVSGETISDRPMMRMLLDQLEGGNIGAVLCIEPQRLTRGDLSDCGRVVNAFRYTNTKIITPLKTYDLDDKYDRKMLQTELIQGNDYLEYTREILQRGKLASVRQGNYVGGRIPFGYRRVYKDERRRRYPTLEIVPAEAEAVRMMYQTYADGIVGAEAIAAIMDDSGFSPPRAKGKWNDITIRKILQNPTYTGAVYYGRLKRTLEMEEGQLRRHIRTQSDYIIIPNCHPAIVSQSLYDAVQERFKRNPHTRPETVKNPLAGLLRCGRCGTSMSAHSCGLRDAYHHDLYKCNNASVCRIHSTRISYLFPAVIDALEREVGDLKLCENNDNSAQVAAHARRIKEIESKLAALDQRENRLMDLLESGTYTPEIYTARRKLLEDERGNLSEQHRQLLQNAPQLKDNRRKRETLEKALAACKRYEDIPEINRLLRACIKRITYHNTHDASEGRRKIAAMEFSIEIELLV